VFAAALRAHSPVPRNPLSEGVDIRGMPLARYRRRFCTAVVTSKPHVETNLITP
jgi:hypothetical protein